MCLYLVYSCVETDPAPCHWDKHMYNRLGQSETTDRDDCIHHDNMG